MAKQSAAPEATLPSEEPTIFTVAPEWVERTSKLGELLNRKKELSSKIPSLRKQAIALGLVNYHELNLRAAPEETPPRMIVASKKAAALLGEFTPPPVVAPGPRI